MPTKSTRPLERQRDIVQARRDQQRITLEQARTPFERSALSRQVEETNRELALIAAVIHRKRHPNPAQN